MRDFGGAMETTEGFGISRTPEPWWSRISAPEISEMRRSWPKLLEILITRLLDLSYFGA
jgi:hypothetical protein